MSLFSSVALIFNGITLAFSLSFLLITLWQDTRKQLNQFFAAFLLLVTLWNSGALLLQISSFVNLDGQIITLMTTLIELGFTGSSIAIYTLTATLAGIYTRRFRALAFSGLFLVVGYQVFLASTAAPSGFQRLDTGTFIYQPQRLSLLYYLIFDVGTLYLAWRNQRKIRSTWLVIGIIGFVLGQTISLFNPALQALSLSISVSSLAAMIISFSLFRREIVTPLVNRNAQIEVMHKVSLVVTSPTTIDTGLDEIVTHAVALLQADGGGILLREDDHLALVALYQLPERFRAIQVPVGQGLIGSVAVTKKSAYVENYRRDWRGKHDFPLAAETFGSVIGVPLIYQENAIGVLLVVAGPQGRLLNSDDVYSLELLGVQAAIAITQGRLFAEQQALTQAVEIAHSQLESLLTSTTNPVVAIDRKFRLVFANPAARGLVTMTHVKQGDSIAGALPFHVLPPNYREAIESLRRNRVYVYEIALSHRTYLCHLTVLGQGGSGGWVAVLNDVTELKELDRLKSEMVRMTSHDLKNPLQAALANLELLNDDLADMDNPEIGETIAIIDKQLNRMNRIISGILDLERLKAGQRAVELCHPKLITEAMLDELRNIAQDKHIKLRVMIQENIPDFIGDSRQFERALINLVENAIKFTPNDGDVSVHVYTDLDKIIFKVQDSGIGIPEAIHEHIFDRFYRGQQAGAVHISGSGLGLNLVKTIVENHDGKIWFISAEGSGSTFFVAVPVVDTHKYQDI